MVVPNNDATRLDQSSGGSSSLPWMPPTLRKGKRDEDSKRKDMVKAGLKGCDKSNGIDNDDDDDKNADDYENGDDSMEEVLKKEWAIRKQQYRDFGLKEEYRYCVNIPDDLIQ